MIEVAGKFDGSQVVVGWEDRQLHGPQEVLLAIIDTAVSYATHTLTCADGTRLSGDILRDPRGFVFSAFKTLQDASTDWEPDNALSPGAMT